ncbi:hypothetical protein PG994_009698 [Apiospora phragmitis]|uniref:Uncharacterized protein n=1 Tax=Apiospora phragmitis TaxID=2905665 RepID=A0ABR1U6U9_9PEZI
MDLSSSPGYDSQLPQSGQRNESSPIIFPNTSSQASGASQNANLPSSSSSLFVPQTSLFNASQFPPPSSQSQPMYNPNLEIYGLAPSTQSGTPPPNALAPNLLITPALHSLQARLNNGNRSFRPATQSRDLRPDERGYWVVDTSAWTPQRWLGTWAHLTEFVGDGCAGWSVSVRRDEDGALLRIYCFGTMVEHVWWLLFQASEGVVVATGGRWFDAGGDMVLAVCARL